MKLKRLLILIGVITGALYFSLGFSSNSALISSDEILNISTKGDSQTITLITGDQVIVNDYDGQISLDIIPAERDGYKPNFEKMEIDDEIYVFPEDILLYIPEKLDQELFNITRLANEGYSDEEMDFIPIIITLKDRISLNGIDEVTQTLANNVTNQHLFSSIQGMSARVNKDQALSFSKVLFSQENQTFKSTYFLQDNIEKIRLDRMLSATLEDTVPQIGAESSWESGYDGTGVKIAVLDTGIDEEHPDLNGKVIEERNFSLDEDSKDLHGHGTHVASIISGSGAASDGNRKGVAYGATLINAKVLGEDGRGLESGIIAAMEWSAIQGADIINMSLGSGPTDGTDPVSKSLNELTEKFGVLFVVAVGNDGPRSETASAPATAESALAVGSVDKQDELAFNSSRGPRINDFSIKPDLTAPGVSINAARAKNTALGMPIDDYYTTASGTSMAAPHVSGAAALLIEKWKNDERVVSPESLKTTLVTTAIAHEDYTVYNQGGGRVDIDRALNQEVYVNQGPLNMGYIQQPYHEADPFTKYISYHNTSDKKVILDLSVEIEAPGTDPIPNELLTLSKKQVVLEAGEVEEIGITLDPKHGDSGLYGGYIYSKSTDNNVEITIPIGFYKEPEMFDLTIKGITYNDREPQYPSRVDVMNVKDTKIFYEYNLFAWDSAGEQKIRVPEGTYSVMGILHSYVDIDFEKPDLTEMVVVGDPEIKIDKDTTIVLDARGANEITVELEDEAVLDSFKLTYYREAEERGSASATFSPNGTDIFAVSTELVDMGKFELTTEWEFTSSSKGLGNSPFIYSLVFPEQAIPTDLSYKVNKENLAQVNHKYYGHNESNLYNVFRHKWRPYTMASLAIATTIIGPTEQMEYYVPGDTRYRKSVSPLGSGISFREAKVSYPESGRFGVSWLKQLMHPGIMMGNPPFDEHTPIYREGNELSVILPEYVDSESHWGIAPRGSTLRIYQNEQLLAQSNQSRGIFRLSPEESTYRMELVVDDDKTWSPFSTKTRTNWTFHSDKPSGNEQVSVPLLLVNYDKELNLDNSEKLPNEIDSPNTLDLHVMHQPGVEGLMVDGAKLWISHNDGENWKEIKNIQHIGGGHFQANLDRGNHEGSGYVSIKVEAWDTEQNKIEQEIIRAYRVANK